MSVMNTSVLTTHHCACFPLAVLNQHTLTLRFHILCIVSPQMCSLHEKSHAGVIQTWTRRCAESRTVLLKHISTFYTEW